MLPLRIFLAFSLASLLSAPASAESRLEGGGAVIIEFVEQYRRDHWTPKDLVASCKKFRAARNNEAFFTPSFTCRGSGSEDSLAVFERDRIDSIRKEINTSAKTVAEIRAMKERQDKFLRAIYSQWASTCRAASAKTNAVNSEAHKATHGGCNYLGNASKVYQAAINANRYAIQMKSNARNYWADYLAKAYEKDRQLVYGVRTRAFQKSGYGKNMQKEIERLYEKQGPYDSLLEGMDYEICMDSEAAAQFEERASVTAKERSDCNSMQ